MVRAEAVYFIDVLPHGNWTRQKLLEIVHANWPALLPRAAALAPSRTPLTDDQVKVARRKGYMTLPQMPDRSVYFPPGGGATASGLSLDALVASDRCFDRLKAYQKWVEGNAEAIAEAIEGTGREVTQPIRLRLTVDEDGSAHAVDDAAMTRFLLGPLLS
jgi:hypothetical protein